MAPVCPQEHWPGAVEPLLEALSPRRVWTPGDDELSSLVRRHSKNLGYDLADSADELTDAVVVSGDANYHLVAACLAAAVASGPPPVGGNLGPPVIVVSATGWPHADRDGYRDPDRIPAADRRAYARCLPDPDEAWLSAEAADLAYALEPGGAANGVRGAVDALLATVGWRARFLEGFGGLAVLAPDVRLTPGGALAEVWDGLGEGAAAQALLRRLDLELGRASLDRAHLERTLAERTNRAGELRASMAAALDELDARLLAETEAVRSVSEALARIGTKLLAGTRREERLEHRLAATEALAAAARTELMEDRRWMADQARLVAGSQAWRVGHRLARTAWMLTFRRQRGTDALERIIVRMERGLEPGGHSDGLPG